MTDGEISALVRQMREETLRQAAAVVAGKLEDDGIDRSWPFWTRFVLPPKNPVAKFAAKASAPILALSDHPTRGAA